MLYSKSNVVCFPIDETIQINHSRTTVTNYK
jgi:hypothetical protein